ncbi:MAG: hypothetical protein Rhirs2KO_32080 [Rhizobiaceae bacterium]
MDAFGSTGTKRIKGSQRNTQREKSLKRYRREWKVNLIEGLNPTWMDLYERIDEIENVYTPHPNTRMWSDYN